VWTFDMQILEAAIYVLGSNSRMKEFLISARPRFKFAPNGATSYY
jgi:hypothetical protein